MGWYSRFPPNIAYSENDIMVIFAQIKVKLLLRGIAYDIGSLPGFSCGVNQHLWLNVSYGFVLYLEENVNTNP